MEFSTWNSLQLRLLRRLRKERFIDTIRRSSFSQSDKLNIFTVTALPLQYSDRTAVLSDLRQPEMFDQTMGTLKIDSGSRKSKI